jgi:16S rRNA (cytosine967-C5)-methyltransferase
MGDDIAARKIALDILNELSQSDELLDAVLDRFAGVQTGLSPQDRRLVNALVFGVLRWRRRLDWLIKLQANLPPARISPSIRNILRIALFQIFYLDRVPDFASVNTAVDMAKRCVSVKSSRFVNGLLRNTLRNRPADMDSALPNDPVSALAIGQSFPDWLIHRWVSRYGIEDAARLCDAMNRIPPVTVRPNILKVSRDELRAMLFGMGENISETPYAPAGLSFWGPAAPIDQLAPFQAGLFTVQDEAAQVATHLLCPEPGETVLDACAGLGGKTGHMAQLMGNTGRILAIDKDPQKLSGLAEEMARLGITNVSIRRMNLSTPDWAEPPPRFDRILLDAPCSGIGVIRRNPDIKWAAHKKDLARFADRQLSYLRAVSQWVAPSGILVYAVCTIAPEETDQVIERFLKTHPQFESAAEGSGLSEKMQQLIDTQGFFRSLPHIHGMDGFFAARLKRRS